MTMNDHARGCEGREYTCTCGYDAERDAEIANLREALTAAGEWINGLPVPTTGATRILTIVLNALSKEESLA